MIREHRIRRAAFQIHLWSGIALGLYIFFMSLTGSVLVYSNELFNFATPEPLVSKSSAPRLDDEQLTVAAQRAYPGYRVTKIERAVNPDQAVDVWLRRGTETRQRLFDARTGDDLGDSVAGGVRFISRLIDLHDNLSAGTTGRKVNAAGALALLLLAATGLVIWWPAAGNWRRNLTLHRGPRFLRHLHGAVGFWSFAFLLIFGISGAYLGNPQPFQDLADRIQPLTSENAGVRFVDKAIYWLAFLHFGRINGIGIPCAGPGFCDQATKFVWSVFGLTPAVMFATGAMLWWKRVLRRVLRNPRL